MQKRAPDRLRGRVISLYVLAWVGLVPLGILVVWFVLQAWVRRETRWLVLAILLHFAVNSIAAIMVLELHLSQLIGELVLLAMAAAVLTLGWRLSAGTPHGRP